MAFSLFHFFCDGCVLNLKIRKYAQICIKLAILTVDSLRTIKKKFVDLIMFFVDFQNFTKINIWLRQNFAILPDINLSWAHVSWLKTVKPYRFSRIGVYQIQTNKHPNKQSLYKDLDIFFILTGQNLLWSQKI